MGLSLNIVDDILEIHKTAQKKVVEYFVGFNACNAKRSIKSSQNSKIEQINKDAVNNIKNSKKKIDSSMKGQWVTAAKKALDEKNKKLEEL